MRGTKFLLSLGCLLAAPVSAGAEMVAETHSELQRRLIGVRHQYLSFDGIDVLGMLAVVLTIVCYSHEKHRPNLALVCAVGGILAAVYGIMIDAWLLSFLEAFWAVASVRRWMRLKSRRRSRRWWGGSRASVVTDPESRIGRMFGSAN